MDPIFLKSVQGDWVNCGEATWRSTWINPFESLGKLEASCLPPPQLQDWHEPTYDCYCSQGTKDPAIAAIEKGALEDIRKFFAKPKDLLRWEVDGVDGDHQSLVAIALTHQMVNGHNVEVLDHLLKLSPKYFIQQMTMVSGGYHNLGPLGNMLGFSLREDKATDLLAVIRWLCRNGLMTETIFKHCSSVTAWRSSDIPDVRPTDWKSAADVLLLNGEGVKGLDDVIAELERWEKMPVLEKRRLTEERFADLLAPVLPKKVVTIKAKGSGYGSSTFEMECSSLTGEHIITISVDQSKDSAWLIVKIAETLGLSKGEVRVVTPQGEILQEDRPVSLATCSS